ncbi:LysR family transcriptional regulator [Burkholderia lata]|nr:LysR family transcriptional regulator [Burkholderia lata]
MRCRIAVPPDCATPVRSSLNHGYGKAVRPAAKAPGLHRVRRRLGPQCHLRICTCTLPSRIGWRDAAAFPWIAPPLESPARTALDAEFAKAGLPPPSVLMESVSWQTNRAVAEQSPCLFVQSARTFELAERAGERVGRLPLKLSTMPETVGALYAAPASVSVTAAIDALKAVTRTDPGAVA